MQKQAELYRGKTKTVYRTENPNLLILEFRNDMSMRDGEYVKKFSSKGKINNRFSYFIMDKLNKIGILTQMEKMISDTECLVKNLDMIPIECVIRNYSAGSLVKRLGVTEGIKIHPPLFELFLKNDKMHDPMINSSYCESFGWVNTNNLSLMKKLTYEVNDVLKKLFDNVDFILVDFKLEFGVFESTVIIGDEFSLDTSRLWDKKTLNKMDKDLFRQNTGKIIEAYSIVSHRLGIKLT